MEDKEAAQKVAVPSMSPSRFLQEQKGIEHIIQEAAKGIYLRGEKWGVAKALRGAVQGLQSGSASPRSSSEKSRWSLDSGKVVSDDASRDLVAKIQALEKRNKSLASMLEKAMDELWIQQKDLQPQMGKEGGSDALSLAIAKVQFVQVYLENASMPLPAEMLDITNIDNVVPETGLSSPQPGHKTPPSTLAEQIIDEKPLLTRTKPKFQRSPSKPSLSSSPFQEPATPPKPGHKTRPPLSQSPFSWMLGEEQRKSGFVATSPFASSTTSRGRTGSLFSDDDKLKPKQQHEKDGDVFTTVGTRGDRDG